MTGTAGGSGNQAGTPGDPPAPGWYEDPLDLSRSRYWDGGSWTEQVAADETRPPAPLPAPAPQPVATPQPVESEPEPEAVVEPEPVVETVEPAVEPVEIAARAEAAGADESLPAGPLVAPQLPAQATQSPVTATHAQRPAHRPDEPVEAVPAEAVPVEVAPAEAVPAEAVSAGWFPPSGYGAGLGPDPGGAQPGGDLRGGGPGDGGLGDGGLRDGAASAPGQPVWGGQGVPRQAGPTVAAVETAAPGETAGPGETAAPVVGEPPPGPVEAPENIHTEKIHPEPQPETPEHPYGQAVEEPGHPTAHPTAYPTADLAPAGHLAPEPAGAPRSRAAVAALSVAALLVVALVAAAVVGLVTDRSDGGGAPAPVAATWPSCTDPARPPAAPAALAPAVSGGSVITPAGATGLVTAFWPLREKALHACDLATLRTLEAGSALRGDRVRSACACLERPAGAPISDLKVFVPRRASFPAWFGAEVTTTATGGTPAVEMLVFTRNSARAHWRLVLATGWPVQPGGVEAAYEPKVGAAGYLAHPGPGAATAARSAAAGLATFWQQARNSGTVPDNPFGRTAWTTDLPQRFASHPQDTVQGVGPGNGLVGHFSYSARPSTRTYHFTVEGGDLACTALVVHSRYTPSAAAAPHQSPDQREWGPAVEPGTYRAIATSAWSQTCFLLPADRSRPVYVLGGDPSVEAVAAGRR